MLTRVLQTKGRKRYFFAYGTGKRTDGKGDGHLVVDVKKPKKAALQEECACQSFTEGNCWSSSDGGSLFFAGKPKLNSVALAKMSLTAKKLTGRAYDFQLPSADEESRSEALAGDEDPRAGPVTPTAAPPPPPPPPPPPTPAAAKGPPPPSPPPPIPQPPATDEAKVRFTQRLKALTPEIAKATAANHPATSELKLTTSEVGVYAKKQDYVQANALLDRVEKLLAQPASGTAPESEKARFTQRLKALSPEIAKATAANHSATAELKLTTSEVGVYAKKQDYVQANALLDRVEKLLAAPTNGAATPEPAAGKPPPGGDLVALQRARLLWVQTRQAVRAELQKLEKVILATTKAEPDFAAISAGTKNLFVMLDVLDERLVDTLDAALNADTPEKRSVLHRDAQEIVEEYVAYVGGEPLLGDIDSNGFADVKVRSSLDKALQYLSSRLK